MYVYIYRLYICLAPLYQMSRDLTFMYQGHSMFRDGVALVLRQDLRG